MMAKSNEIYQPGVKYPIVKATFDRSLAAHNYQQLLQDLTAITVTRDNVNEDLTERGREVLKLLEVQKNEQSAEPLQHHRDIMAAYKDLCAPISEQIERIAGEKKVVALGIHNDQQRQLAEQNRINNAKSAIINFTNGIAVKIAEAKTDSDIVILEKLIGAEKTKKTVYQEFLQDLIDSVEAMRPQIKQQKGNIRDLQKLAEAEKKAEEAGNIVELTRLKEEKEYQQAVIQETGIRIHETAFEKASSIDIVAPEVMDTAPKGRSNWKFRVDNINLLQKKMPHLVKLVPDEDAINLLLKTKKADGSLEGKMEETVFGLVFYNDKTFSK
jgi:hypothetical protein